MLLRMHGYKKKIHIFHNNTQQLLNANRLMVTSRTFFFWRNNIFCSCAFSEIQSDAESTMQAHKNNKFTLLSCPLHLHILLTVGRTIIYTWRPHLFSGMWKLIRLERLTVLDKVNTTQLNCFLTAAQSLQKGEIEFMDEDPWSAHSRIYSSV